MSNAKLEKKLCLGKTTPEPVFDLSDCDIKQIPSGIFSVIKVLRKEVLYLQRNNLSSLKEGGNLQDLYLLELLDISSNKINKLPSDVQYLKNLRVLRLDKNELTSLPSEIGSLPCLEHLTVASNKLKFLPDSIGGLKNLQHLDIRSNYSLRSLPVTLYQNKLLKCILLDDDREWIEPPTSVVRQKAEAIIKYFAQKKDPSIIEDNEVTEAKDILVSGSLQKLSIYDKFIQDKLRRLEKEKEEKLTQQLEMEKNILDQKNKELLLRQQNYGIKQRLMESLSEDQRIMDQRLLECHRKREEEQNSFIRQLQSVENKADDVIEQLLKTNNAQKKKYISSIVSTLMEDVPQKSNFQERRVLESMEKLLSEEYVLSLKLKENDINRENLLIISSFSDKQMENRIFDSLSKRHNEQSSLIDSIQKDTNLQHAAVLMLIEKSDHRNVELQNQISIIQNQLSNLTALELHNRNSQMTKHVNELSERRVILTNLLQDIFSQQQSRQKQLVDQLREVENFQSSVFQNKNDYWLIQYQRLLDNCSSLSAASQSVSSALIYELALFGVSHYSPLLSTLNLESVESLREITTDTLELIGIKSFEDRLSVLNAIQHFINDQKNSDILPSPAAIHSVVDNDHLNLNQKRSPSGPEEELIDVSLTSDGINEVLRNECVVCLDKQSNIVFLPCGHLCSCSDCSHSINQCPLCRGDIKSKMQIYTA